MKTFFILFIFFSALSAQEVPKITSIASSVSNSNQKDIIVIDPNQRSQDFTQAYEIIKKGKSPQSIFFHTSDGKSITNVVEMMPMNNGTLILFKVMTTMGTKYELIPIEQLVSISQL